MRVVLIGNHPADRQESMLRFTSCLADELNKRGIEAEILAPAPIATRLAGSFGTALKWLAYVDKFVIFPFKLRRRVRNADGDTVFHIIDHSNAMYVRELGGRKHLVTCHDLLAVRGALGDPEAYCEISSTGKLLQRWIRHGLGRARNIACVSMVTAGDFRRLIGDFSGWLVVVPNGLNSFYHRIELDEAWARLAGYPLQAEVHFILSIGSSQLRKNREGAVRILHRLGSRFPGFLVFAGDPLTPAQKALVDSLNLTDRIVDLGPVGNPQLEALYSAAHALLFTSKAEGFGWPVLEAQACGCPVVCSDRTSIPEVAGEGAFIHDVGDEAGFAESIIKLCDPVVWDAQSRRGLANAGRMTTEGMVDNYIALYRQVLAGE